MYAATTQKICVSVEPIYLEDQSSPEDSQFMWAYHVRIDNRGVQSVQVLSRYWHITDSIGRIQEVRGAGVVGEQPVVKPGGSYEYTSGTPLPTPSGIMLGSYGVRTADGQQFDIEIPAFSLDSPYQSHQLN
ncbi:MAG: Co2+/Mg2+ efflux protein ApaG [Pseudomonadota bacterium]|nr:Co2+/Mg2+ efflux protein ApaG [Pseudomonadota bacterium]